MNFQAAFRKLDAEAIARHTGEKARKAGASQKTCRIQVKPRSPGPGSQKDENNASFRNSARGLPVHAGSRRFNRGGHDYRRERHGGVDERYSGPGRRRHLRRTSGTSRPFRQRLRRHLRTAQRQHARSRKRPHRDLSSICPATARPLSTTPRTASTSRQGGPRSTEIPSTAAPDSRRARSTPGFRPQG